MSRNLIRRALSTVKRRRVRALLMGGQACILYGAAEFSRDIDFAVAVSGGNLDRLRRALADLKAEQIYFPALGEAVLGRGHACHFRCRGGLRIDVMSVMRGVDPFERLWSRRRTIRVPGVGPVAVLAIPDLVQAKKTQRDRDWPMIRRLLEVDIARSKPSPARVAFWLRECRTPELLRELVRRFGPAVRRPAVAAAARGNEAAVVRALRREEDRERAADRRYWAPLKRQLERWRLSRPAVEA